MAVIGIPSSLHNDGRSIIKENTWTKISMYPETSTHPVDFFSC